MLTYNWLTNNYIEIFGAVTGVIYVFLEIRQHIWLWPVGIITSAVYVWVFLTGKLYADMSLQVYYLVISVLGWYWWISGDRKQDKTSMKEKAVLTVTRLKIRTGYMLTFVLILLYSFMWLVLSRLTDSPVPEWDSLVTSLSIIATWMLARKIYEHWYIWILVNTLSAFLFFTRGLYPTVILYIIYGIMSFSGLKAWKRTIHDVETITDCEKSK